MKYWNRHTSWEEAEKAWDEGATKRPPLKGLKVIPQIPGITPDTKKKLRWKSFKYMVKHDENWLITRHFLKKPFLYGFRFLLSLFKKKSFTRDGDLFFYGLPSLSSFLSHFKKPNALLVVGFSYCQKPFECPSGRFTDQCIHDPDHAVCRKCDIGKILHALPEEKTVPIVIPTIHYIGDHIFRTLHQHKDKQILFLITACELTLNMFGDYGNMAGVKGIGVRLDGRICNTMKAFELSEKGIKPGLTVLKDPTRKQILDLIRSLRSNASF